MYSRQDLAGAEELLNGWIADAKAEEDRPSCLTLQNELEGLYRVTGRAEEACRVSEDSLSLIGRMDLTGTVHHGTTLLNAATANRAAGHPEEALRYYREAEEVYRNIPDLPDKDYYRATLCNNLGQVYQQMGDDAEAENYLREALGLIEGFAGTDSEAATTKSNLALVLQRLGQQEQAQEMIRQALLYYETPAGQKDNHYTAALGAAGQIAYAAGDLTEAEAYLTKALEKSLQIFGETPETELLRRNLETVRQMIR